jgi:thymidine phosphorylase
MDVKTGTGAFMRRTEDAHVLAQTLVDLGGALGMTVQAHITDMNQTLGRKAGNALEVLESIEILRGEGPSDAQELVVRFAAAMGAMSGLYVSQEEARAAAQGFLESGAAQVKFGEMIAAQGGDRKVVDDTSRLPLDAECAPFLAPASGYIAAIDCEKVGQAIVALGGGRRRIEDPVDPAVGLDVTTRMGDEVKAGDLLAHIYYRTAKGLDDARTLLQRAYTISDQRPADLPLIIATL